MLHDLDKGFLRFKKKKKKDKGFLNTKINYLDLKLESQKCGRNNSYLFFGFSLQGLGAEYVVCNYPQSKKRIKLWR